MDSRVGVGRGCRWLLPNCRDRPRSFSKMIGKWHWVEAVMSRSETSLLKNYKAQDQAKDGAGNL